MAKYVLQFWLSKKEPPYGDFDFDASVVVKDVYADGPATKDMLQIINSIMKEKGKGYNGYRVAVIGSNGRKLKTWEVRICNREKTC